MAENQSDATYVTLSLSVMLFYNLCNCCTNTINGVDDTVSAVAKNDFEAEPVQTAYYFISSTSGAVARS